MNIKPLGDNIVIQHAKKDDAQKSKTETGIYLPETADNENTQSQIGKIVAIGDNLEIKVKKGQSVVFKQFAGTEIENDGEKYVIIKNEDILAVIE